MNNRPDDDPYAGSAGGSITEASPSQTSGSGVKGLRQLLGVGSLGAVSTPMVVDGAPGPQLAALNSISSSRGAGLSRESSASTSNPSGPEAASAAAAALAAQRSVELSAGGSIRRPMRTDSAGPPVSRVASEPLSLSGSSYTGVDGGTGGGLHSSAAAAAAALRAQGSAQAMTLPVSVNAGASGTRRASRAAQSRFFSLMLRSNGGGSQGRLLYGLRVRCGVASGVLSGNVDIRSSAVFHLAKGEGVAGARGFGCAEPNIGVDWVRRAQVRWRRVLDPRLNHRFLGRPAEHRKPLMIQPFASILPGPSPTLARSRLRHGQWRPGAGGRGDV
jgi:hypothetical protein